MKQIYVYNMNGLASSSWLTYYVIQPCRYFVSHFFFLQPLLCLLRFLWGKCNTACAVVLSRASFWPPSVVYISAIITDIHFYKLHLFHDVDLCGQLSCTASTPVFSYLWVAYSNLFIYRLIIYFYREIGISQKKI